MSNSDRFLQCGGRSLDLSCPQVMGILNVTPDSFSDGGTFHDGAHIKLDAVLLRVEQMLSEGAAIIDVGGESTRPGAEAVTVQQEMDRVLPVVEAIGQRFDAIVSVDTSNPEIMRQSAQLGAGMINDVRGLERQGAMEAAIASGLAVCLMHMDVSPQSMLHRPHYNYLDVDVIAYLRKRVECCIEAGMLAGNIVLDPGFGFGKSVEHNLALIHSLPDLLELGCPVLVGLSRKSLIGKLLGREVSQRLAGSLTLAVLAAERGARIIRAHDVAETVDAMSIVASVEAVAINTYK